MPTWVTIVVAVCGCTGGFNLISLVLQHRWNKKEKKDQRLDSIEETLEAIKEAQRSSMEERIRYLVGHFNSKGEISLMEKANLHDMHKRYVGVGGNGNLDTEMELLDTIPVKG